MALEGGGSLPTEGTTLEGKHEYCTTKTQTVLHDGGARRQSGSQSHTDFDLAPFTSYRDNNIILYGRVVTCPGNSPLCGIKLPGNTPQACRDMSGESRASSYA